jgi:hypothetical protein
VSAAHVAREGSTEGGAALCIACPPRLTSYGPPLGACTCRCCVRQDRGLNHARLAAALVARRDERGQLRRWVLMAARAGLRREEAFQQGRVACQVEGALTLAHTANQAAWFPHPDLAALWISHATPISRRSFQLEDV